MFFFCLFWRTFSLHFPPEFNRSQGENTTKGLVTLEIINLIFCILVCLILVGCFCSGVFFIFFFFPFAVFVFEVNLTEAIKLNSNISGNYKTCLLQLLESVLFSKTE